MPLNPASYTCAAPFAHSSGPLDATIAICGEAWGADEEKAGGVPFIGAAGQELSRLLDAAGIKRSECFLTNLLAFRPDSNNLLNVVGTRKEVGKAYNLPHFHKKKFLLPQYLPELERLRAELSQVSSNIIVCLGGSALWGLMGTTAISGYRGTVNEASLVPGRKVLPTYHPSFVLQNWKQRTVVISDLMKARRDSAFPEIRRPARDGIIINPTLQVIKDWLETNRCAPIIGSDIETKNGTMTSISFAVSAIPYRALVVPFWNQDDPSRSYWQTPSLEFEALMLVKEILELPAKKLFHNGIYDVQYLFNLGMPPRNFCEDTMILQHCIVPEMKKGLGFLGSIYSGLSRHDLSSEGPWKLEGREYENKDIEVKTEADA